MNVQNLITKLILNKDLSNSELNLLFNKIINAEINENLISAILTLITRNGFNYKNILSAAKILRKKLIMIWQDIYLHSISTREKKEIIML